MEIAGMNKKEMIKNLSLGFLPIIIYIFADALFGLTIGLIAAIGAGLIEMGLIFYKEKKIEFFILVDIGLLVALGFVSLSIQNDIFIKVKPALINGIMLILFFLTGFTRNSFLISMTTRRIKGMEIQPEQVLAIKKISKTFFFVFLIHTVLIVYSAFYMSTAAWGFISGGLFYILAGGVVVYEWIKIKLNLLKQKRQFANEEWFDIVDPEGRVIGLAPRSVVHGNPDLLHPVVHIHIFNNRDSLFLQKRAENKQVQPGKWDTSVGGHISKGERVEIAVQRETEEEIGIKKIEVKPLLRYIWKTDFESELIYVFKTVLSGNNDKININKEEITEGKFWKKSEIARNLGKNIFTPNFEHEYQVLKKLKLI
ncbi:MAG: NUDIX domain-containing protein [Calditrichia bacterium]|nr:NUDIX domain-containing protein [Calditrichia bacterium]